MPAAFIMPLTLVLKDIRRVPSAVSSETAGEYSISLQPKLCAMLFQTFLVCKKHLLKTGFISSHISPSPN